MHCFCFKNKKSFVFFKNKNNSMKKNNTKMYTTQNILYNTLSKKVHNFNA